MSPRFLRRRVVPEPAWAASAPEDLSGPDVHPPLLSTDEAVRFRRLVAETMGGLGREVVVHGEAIEGADGQVFGLSNLSAIAAAGPESEWPGPAPVGARARPRSPQPRGDDRG